MIKEGEPKFEKEPGKLEARERLKKKMREVLAWGFITISTLGIGKVLLPEKPKEGLTLDQILTVYVDKDKEINKTEKKELWGKIDYLREQFGDLTVFWLQQSAELSKGVKRETPQIKGFKKLHPSFNNEYFQRIWNEKYYPKDWINERIGKIEYVGSKLDSEEWSTYASYRRSEKKRGNVRFFKPSGSLPEDISSIDVNNVINALDHYFAHEAGHANDWEEEDLDFRNRVEFLHEVTQHCFQEDAYRDAGKYIESIKNDDPQAEKYCKAIEYWAMSCEQYFTSPDTFREAWPLEFDLVDKYVKKEDPDFNVFEKTRQKEAVIDNLPVLYNWKEGGEK